MQIILKKDVENLGLEFDVIDVKPGYARNFLIPQGFALLATPKNKAELEATLEARKEEEAKLISVANAKIEQLKKVNLSIPAKVGTGGKLFGSINNGDISDALKKQGVDIDKKFIKIPGSTVKRVGKSTAKVRLHRSVEIDYEFEVVSDQPVSPPKETEKKSETNNEAKA